ncbi:MAG: inositol monophosphatase family protein, partial [Bacteroidota bacterium]
YLWIVDPIDGTANFVHGVYPHAVSIGLQHEGRLAVGVVYELGRDELFTATRGGGTFLNGRRQRVTETNTLGESLVATGFPFRSHTFRYADAYLNVLRTFMSQCHGVRRLGSAAVDMAYVCCGRFDGFFEMGLSPWDVAAGALLVEEAGGRVTDFSAEERAPLFNGQMIATNSRLHGAFQEAIGPLREALRDG